MRADALTFLIQIVYPFFSFHRKCRDGIKVKVGVFHSDSTYFSAIVGGEIVGQPLGVHTRGVYGAELSLVCAKKPMRLVNGAHKMKKSRDSRSFFIRRQGASLCVNGTDETGRGGKVAKTWFSVFFKRFALSWKIGSVRENTKWVVVYL